MPRPLPHAHLSRTPPPRPPRRRRLLRVGRAPRARPPPDTPLAVASSELGGTVITATYAARAAGVHRGARVAQAVAQCPALVVAPQRPPLYVARHHDMRSAVDALAPIEHVPSIDELYPGRAHASMRPRQAGGQSLASRAGPPRFKACPPKAGAGGRLCGAARAPGGRGPVRSAP